MTKCPICEQGTLKPTTEEHKLFGVNLGKYPGEKCTNCGEVFTDSAIIEKIETAAKQKGIWGIGRKTKIAKAGNSLAVRIPQEVAKYLKLKIGKEAYVHPEQNKIIIEMCD